MFLTSLNSVVQLEVSSIHNCLLLAAEGSYYQTYKKVVKHDIKIRNFAINWFRNIYFY